MFAARFSGLPSQWQVHNISYYEPAGGLLRADEYMLTTGSSRFHPGVGDLGVWTDAPYVIVHPARATAPAARAVRPPARSSMATGWS